jgi:hypothetical protein
MRFYFNIDKLSRQVLAWLTLRKEEKLLREYLAKLGKKGGKARAKNYDRETLSRWGKLGGRPPKKKRS